VRGGGGGGEMFVRGRWDERRKLGRKSRKRKWRSVRACCMRAWGVKAGTVKRDSDAMVCVGRVDECGLTVMNGKLMMSGKRNTKQEIKICFHDEEINEKM